MGGRGHMTVDFIDQSYSHILVPDAADVQTLRVAGSYSYNKMSQSINESITQSVNQAINQSINQPLINQSINQSINQWKLNLLITAVCHCGP